MPLFFLERQKKKQIYKKKKQKQKKLPFNPYLEIPIGDIIVSCIIR